MVVLYTSSVRDLWPLGLNSIILQPFVCHPLTCIALLNCCLEKTLPELCIINHSTDLKKKYPINISVGSLVCNLPAFSFLFVFFILFLWMFPENKAHCCADTFPRATVYYSAVPLFCFLCPILWKSPLHLRTDYSRVQTTSSRVWAFVCLAGKLRAPA